MNCKQLAVAVQNSAAPRLRSARRRREIVRRARGKSQAHLERAAAENVGEFCEASRR